MNTSKLIHGFVLTRVRDLPELGGKLWEYEHARSGARLCWLDRPDENKTFSIAFRTLPEDSTGVFHILEHSVLCGSDKYPVKEPFVELLKSSVQTFLNALTFPDKTVYPVSSRNDRDFLNLVDVYLDAVLHPAIYHKPEIFLQEGWRYEGEGDAFCCQGVVLNEMKGAYASPDTVLESTMFRYLFPDICYRYDYGGEPDEVVTLTYEQFLAAHRKYYHPSNAYISLVGAIDRDAVFARLDEYLRPYERQVCDFPIPTQAPVPALDVTVPYEIGPGEPTEGRAVICRGTLLAGFDEPARVDAAYVLADYLTGDDDAVLRRAVLSKGLCSDFTVNVHDGLRQSWVSWDAWDTDPDRLPALRQTVREVLTELADRGLDRERLDACFRRYAFRMRDRDTGGEGARSINEALELYDAWLYGGDPADGLLVEDALSQVARWIDEGYFEQLVRDLFLDNTHAVTATLVPSNTLGEEKAAREAERLEALRRTWTEADWNRQRDLTARLERWQGMPDSPEALATIPMLRLSDLTLPAPLRREKTALEGVALHRHTLGSPLVHLRLHFAAADLSDEDLKLLPLLGRLYGSLATEVRDRSALGLALRRTVGRLELGPTVLDGTTPERFRAYLSVSAACLPEQAEAAADLIAEILTRSRWDDRALLREILRQLRTSTKMALTTVGHQYAATRAASGLGAKTWVRELTAGVTQAQAIQAWSEADDAALDALLDRLAALARRLIVRKRLTLGCSETVTDAVLHRLIEGTPDGGQAAPDEGVRACPGGRREGIVIPSEVGYAAMETNFRRLGHVYDPHLPVLGNVLNFSYLWSEIRVKEGAYGCGFGALDSGELFCYTYRDPQPVRSLEIIRGAADYVRGFCAGEPDLTGSILSAMAAVDPLRTAEERMTLGDQRFFRGVTEEAVRERCAALLNTTPADLLALCPLLDALARTDAICLTAARPVLTEAGMETIIQV